ncbi:histidine phosphatase family protein [Mycolicibacterium sp. PAM1]|uniref:histidine phosphatase family protein n=1 Tax=Mycolicibacterium sp. PAM1 TaxID=2853535 RepID=UPI001C3DFA06|nr:histidine phosphatase family protein [Mycolicibacterium sp. PAM1]MBV5243782.1 histidine phosphatase family protein [Mycolicibacterium sp. PAM1]
MSEVVRLTFVSHGMTDAMAAGRFPTDEPVNPLGRRQIGELEPSALGPVDRALCGPESRTQQTAEMLGLRPVVESALADLDCGRWRGTCLGEVLPEEMTIWLTDPARAPHGGESVVDLVTRVGAWMDTLASERVRVVAVTHPAVVRAAVLVALNAPAKAFWRIDVAPASRTVLHCRGHAWTLRV